MWMTAVFCYGAFMACQGVYNTESNPLLSSYWLTTQEECVKRATDRARTMAAENPGKDIRWKCIDISKTPITEVK